MGGSARGSETQEGGPEGLQKPGVRGGLDTGTLEARASLLPWPTWNYEGEGLAQSQTSARLVPTQPLNIAM